HPEREEAGRDPRSGAERLGDALVELTRRGLVRGDAGVEAGEPARVTVTVPLEVLESRSGAGLLGFGDGTLSAAIDAETARRLACDARVVPIVLGTRGEPLDVGREARLANRAQRRALAQRDGGCAFPGCDVPPQWCVAHHVVHWIDGGETVLENLVLLCCRHHTVIHTQEWKITMEGGFPLVHPPPWIPGGPRRNPLHRPDLVGIVPAPRPPTRIVNLEFTQA
ncbi:MAG: HNH endonuclease, partial [Actinomycetota bacterium]|nr:HNH endonuclease [Actinomycetota bacterium]